MDQNDSLSNTPFTLSFFIQPAVPLYADQQHHLH